MDFCTTQLVRSMGRGERRGVLVSHSPQLAGGLSDHPYNHVGLPFFEGGQKVVRGVKKMMVPACLWAQEWGGERVLSWVA